MSGYRISEVAERTGISVTTLRYYEDEGIVEPAGRTAAGYRVYDERAVARLTFVAGAKRLGIALSDIRSLVSLWNADECAPVQQALACLTDSKLRELGEQSEALNAFMHELHGIADRLQTEPHAGACNDSCACGTVATAPAASTAQPAAFSTKKAAAACAIACTLNGAESIEQRLAQWHDLLATATQRTTAGGGIRVTFPPGGDSAAEVARLAAAEAGCCGWIDFRVTIRPDAVVLDVQAPAAGQEVLASMFLS